MERPYCMNDVFLLTGGNIGNRMQYLLEAANRIEKIVGSIVQQSSVYETAAWGKTKQSAFLNQVLVVSTKMTAEEVLTNILAIEQQLGRIRKEKMDPRTIDIDILYFNNEMISTPHLIVPHQHLQNRKFVLIPLVEIAPNFVHPILLQSNTQLLQNCADTLEVTRFTEGK